MDDVLGVQVLEPLSDLGEDPQQEAVAHGLAAVRLWVAALELHQVPAPHVVQHEVQLVHLTREERGSVRGLKRFVLKWRAVKRFYQWGSVKRVDQWRPVKRFDQWQSVTRFDQWRSVKRIDQSYVLTGNQ